MASEVTVFVVFNSEELPTPIDIRAAALQISHEHPRWSIGDVGRQSFRTGRYDQLPVMVSLCHEPFVLDESRLMATKMHSLTPSLRDQVAHGTARFEVHWNLRQDRDVVPETASVVIDCAQALARLTQGVTLVEGARVIPNDANLDDGQAYSTLFPEW